MAIKSDVGYTFGRVVGLGTNRASADARASRRSATCSRSRCATTSTRPAPSRVRSRRATGTRTNSRTWSRPRIPPVSAARRTYSLCSTPNPGLAFNPSAPDDDPVNHGPIIELVGQGASPSNAVSFRGFVALDIRNFQDATPPSNRCSTRGVGRHERQHAKAMEAGWVAKATLALTFHP